VTKIELGRDSCWLEARGDRADWTIGTSATQAGPASALAPSSAVCSGRPLLDIANRNPAETVAFWDVARPFEFIIASVVPVLGSFGLGGGKTCFAEYLSTLHRVGAEAGSIL
jgi:hypothetical protein